MSEVIARYYAWLSSLTTWLAPPVGDLADGLNIPLLSTLLFGLLGALAPCQLSTNLAVLAYLSRGASEPRRMWRQTLLFVAGKATVYLLLGIIVVGLGLQLSQIAQTFVPGVVVARRALGPLLLLVGLFMLGLLRFHRAYGRQASAWFLQKSTPRGGSPQGAQGGLLPPYLMGAAFSLTFCPTLFWLFFGLTIPLAIASPGGWFFPGIFAVGTALPVLGLASLLASDILPASQFVKRFKRADVWLQRLAGVIFVLIGINEIVLYWLI